MVTRYFQQGSLAHVIELVTLTHTLMSLDFNSNVTFTRENCSACQLMNLGWGKMSGCTHNRVYLTISVQYIDTCNCSHVQGEIISMSWMDLSVEQLLRNHIWTLEGEEIKSSGKWYASEPSSPWIHEIFCLTKISSYRVYTEDVAMCCHIVMLSCLYILCRDGVRWHKSVEDADSSEDICHSWTSSAAENKRERKNSPCSNKMAVLCVDSP